MISAEGLRQFLKNIELRRSLYYWSSILIGGYFSLAALCSWKNWWQSPENCLGYSMTAVLYWPWHRLLLDEINYSICGMRCWDEMLWSWIKSIVAYTFFNKKEKMLDYLPSWVVTTCYDFCFDILFLFKLKQLVKTTWMRSNCKYYIKHLPH